MLASKKLLYNTERRAQACSSCQPRAVGWEGEWEGVSRGRGICINMIDSSCCMVETNATLVSNYLPIKNNKTSQEKKKNTAVMYDTRLYLIIE